ncbi:MAG: dihydroneopterin triphosphate diphosphatase [Thermomicrobiales bacterium]|nr:MAG: dihydroneopterin triphosphate diphosphatase [Thermomicrobiales bacterium]
MSFKQPVSALVVIHTQKLDVLLLERARHPGYWQSVTGSAEPGEALADTARREVFEETGIDASLYSLEDWKRSSVWEIFLEWRFRYAPGVTHNEEHVFSLCVPEGIPVAISPTEHRAFVWLPWRQAAEKCFSYTNRDTILELPLRLAHSTP